MHTLVISSNLCIHSWQDTKSSQLTALRSLHSNWRQESARKRHSLGLSSSYKGWTGRSDKHLTGMGRLDRNLDILDVAWGMRSSKFPPGTPTNEIASGFWANVSQSVETGSWGTPGTLCQRGMWYSFEKDTTLDGFDHMALQGVPASSINKLVSSYKLKVMAGEAFSCISISTVLYAYYLNPKAPWWLDSQPSARQWTQSSARQTSSKACWLHHPNIARNLVQLTATRRDDSSLGPVSNEDTPMIILRFLSSILWHT